MTDQDYDVKKDPLFIDFINQKPLSKESKTEYESVMYKFCKLTQTQLTKTIQECRNQQNKVIEKTTRISQEDNTEIVEKEVIRFDVNSPESIIKQVLDSFLQECRNRNNKNITINNNMVKIRAFFKHYGIEVPKWQKLPDDIGKWYLLSKDDINYVINDCHIIHQSLIKFLISSGMRVSDALSLTIGDFMTATQEYHNFVDVEDFVENAPDDMIGSWYFHPRKTQRRKVECQTFNSPEASNSILQHLRSIKNDYIPSKNYRSHLNIHMSKDDALFPAKNTLYKEPIPTRAVANTFTRKNRKLKEYRISKIKQAIKEGRLSYEDEEREISKIPRFHAHACRKYFETMISRNCGDLRICTLMEGHVSPVKTDSSYIKKDMQEVKEYYMKALDDLSLEKTETKVFTSEVRREMESKINNLEKELESKTDENRLLNDKVNDVLDRLGSIEKNISWEDVQKEY